MKRTIAAGLALGIFLLLPAALPHYTGVSYEPVTAAPMPTVNPPVIESPPPPVSIFDRVLPDVHVHAEEAIIPVQYLGYWDLLFILAETSWRPYITSNTFYAEELGMWFHDDYYRDKLYALMMCESSGRPDAIGDLDTGPSYGLFQINVRYWNQLIGTRDVLDPYDNAQIAYEIWKHSDYSFKRWSCDPTGG